MDANTAGESRFQILRSPGQPIHPEGEMKSVESGAASIFERTAPWLIGLADKLRRVRDGQLSDADSAMMLRAAAADVELVWRYLAARAETAQSDQQWSPRDVP